MTDFKNIFEDLQVESIREQYNRAHDRMKTQLKELEVEYLRDGVDNYGTLRLLPSDLDIGAGY